MNGLIVIDGCDGTGKTTLAEAICKKFGGHYLHNTYRWPTKMPLYHTASLHYALKLARHKLVVIDRLWMSEAIYAAVYRDGSPWPHMGRMVDRMVRRFGGVYILTQSPENHKQKFDELKSQRTEMYDDVEEVRKRYDMLFEGGFAGHDRDYVQQLSVFGMRMRDDVLPYRYDIEGRDLDTYLDMVTGVLKQRQDSQLWYMKDMRHENFAGHLGDAEYIFVGDSTNSKMRAINWPWYDFGNSSELFAQVQHDLLFDETLAVYTNANSANGPMYIQDCLAQKPNLKVIALGGSAAETLDQCNIRFQQVMHPSYAKRFNKVTEFRNQLREVICHEHD
jgi:thymidylate kinase